MLNRVLVIGGGAAGMTGALEIAAKGYEACLVEKAEDIGGHAINYCCKAIDKCNKCSACLVPQAKAEIGKKAGVTIYKNSTVTEISGQAGNFKVNIQTPRNQVKLEVGAIIVATGFTPFDIANKRKEYGYGTNDRVITGLQLEAAIRSKGSLGAAFGPVRNIGFVQCVGSRDLSLGNVYCSKVCCMYAVKLAKLIRSELPEVEVSVYYMDLQTFGRGFDRYMEEVRMDKKIRLIRGIPSKIYAFPNDRLTVKYADTLTGEVAKDKYDLVVLSTAVTPGIDTAELASILGIDLDEYGFFKADPAEPIFTNRKGIYLAGTCQSPKDIQQSIMQAKAAASKAIEMLSRG